MVNQSPSGNVNWTTFWLVVLTLAVVAIAVVQCAGVRR